MKSALRIALLLLLATGLVACGEDDDPQDQTMPATVAEAAANDGRFTTLVDALEATGLDAALAGAGPFTVFAPTDDAFALLPAGLVDLGASPATAGGAGTPRAALSTNELADLLSYHVLNEELDAEGVIASDVLETLTGGTIDVQVIDGTVVLDGRVQITSTDMRAGNGIIHVIDAVLIDGAFPGTLVDAVVASPRFSTLKDAVVAESLDSVLAGTNGGDGYTVLAPTNAAFAALPEGTVDDLVAGGLLDDVLLYHVIPLTAPEATVVTLDSAPTAQGNDVAIQVSNGTVVLDGRVQVVSTDIEAENGVIHVIDSVLVPIEYPGTVVDALAASPRFSTLVGALGTADLAATLDGLTDVTVLAPTNDAFDLLPDGLVASLSGEALAPILLYHVLNVEAPESLVVTLETAETAEGGFIDIAIDDATVVIDGRVQVTFTDIETASGVIHVLDAVLVPGAFPGTVVDALVASPRFSTLVGAVVAEDLAGTLAGDNSGNGFTVFAPTNGGFARLPEGLVAEVAGDDALDDVLLYHVLGAEVDSTGAVAAAGTAVPTLAPSSGGTFAVSVDVDGDGDLFLDARTQVTFTDIEASNGVIHVLDSVLVPGVDFPGSLVEALAAYPRFDSLVGAVVLEDLVGAVTDVTVFAPTNDAFAAVSGLNGNTLADVLAYHLLADIEFSGDLGVTETTLQGDTIAIDVSSGVVINGTSNVIFTDIGADDGVIHVIDEVLIPPAP